MALAAQSSLAVLDSCRLHGGTLHYSKPSQQLNPTCAAKNIPLCVQMTCDLIPFLLQRPPGCAREEPASNKNAQNGQPQSQAW